MPEKLLIGGRLSQPPFSVTNCLEHVSSTPPAWWIDGAKGKLLVTFAASQPHGADWLLENGPRELERLFQSIVFYPSAPLVLTDNDRRYREASVGAGRLLGLPRKDIIGRRLDDFTDSNFKPVISERWNAFLKEGEQEGTIPLVDAARNPREVEYLAKGNVLPVRHLLVLRDKVPKASVPAWVQDYALFLLDVDGRIVAWYAEAQRIYGYTSSEIVGRNAAVFYPEEDSIVRLQEKLKRSASEGHAGAEGWHVKMDGSRFWANTITMALKDEKGELKGFARIVRDFSDRHERDEKLRRDRARLRSIPAKLTIAGIVSGEFDRIPEANDAFLDLVGYSRDDLNAGRLHRPDLTPPECAPLDELAMRRVCASEPVPHLRRNSFEKMELVFLS
jgi:PAS domain S-box-containing protein